MKQLKPLLCRAPLGPVGRMVTRFMTANKLLWPLMTAAVLLLSPPAAAWTHDAPILGTMPPYPGATRPLAAWENESLAIALTTDKPEAVVAYYIYRLSAAGWQPAKGIAAEARADARAGHPAWLTFNKAGQGRLDIQVTPGKIPGRTKPVTMIYYQSQFIP